MQRKRESSSERYKRRIKQRRIFVFSVFAVVLLLCICLFTPIFGISEITVSGNTLLAAEDVIAASGIEKGENVFRINTRKAEEALSSVAYITGAQIKRKFPAKIVIEINEAKQDLIIDTPTEFIVTTIDGRVLKKTDDVTDLTSPLVYGIEVTNAELAKKIEGSDNEVLNMNLERIGCFYETSCWDEIDEFYVDDISNFSMAMKSGMKVMFGRIDSTESLQRKIKMLEQILPQVQQTEKSYLDLTTDKGYFGEYTDEELEEMEERKENGDALLPDEEIVSSASENELDTDRQSEEDDTQTDKKDEENGSAESSQNTSKPSTNPGSTSQPEDEEDTGRKKVIASVSPSPSASVSPKPGTAAQDTKESAENSN